MLCFFSLEPMWVEGDSHQEEEPFSHDNNSTLFSFDDITKLAHQLMSFSIHVNDPELIDLSSTLYSTLQRKLTQ